MSCPLFHLLQNRLEVLLKLNKFYKIMTVCDSGQDVTKNFPAVGVRETGG